MKKIFSLALMATALLISGQVKAAVAELWISTEKTDIVADLNEALSVISANPNTVATIKLLQDATLSSTGGTDAMTGLTDRVTLNNGEKITIDLNGYNLAQSLRFNLVHASIYLINSQPASGGVVSATIAQPYNTYGSSNQDEEYGFSTLYVGANVTVDVPGEYALGIFNRGYLDNPKTKGAGAGVTIDIWGTVNSGSGVSANGYLNVTKGNVPVINIHAGASLTQEGNASAAAVYAAGYCKWNIEGDLTGSIGLYVKSGEVVISGNATITSNATSYAEVLPNGSGITGGTGNAVIIDSKEGYVGDIVVTIKDEPTISGATGYALYEVNTDAQSNHTQGIVIEGGNFNGGNLGCVSTTPAVKQEIVDNATITGGTFSGNEIKDYISNVNGVIEVKEGEETKYVVNGMPTGKEWVATIAGAQSTDYVKIAADEEVASDKEIAYLNIPGANKVTVRKGAKLAVGEAVLGEEATIEVEAGGKLVINGTNGLIAFLPENLVIKADATDGMGTFVLNPAVKANKTPYATVEYMTSAFCGKKEYSIGGTQLTDYHWEVVASPFADIDSIVSVPTYFARFADGAFVTCSRTDIVNEVDAFGMFAMCPDAQAATKYTFYGKLQGVNDLNNFPVTKKFNYMGNAYTGKMNAKEMVQELQQSASDVRTLVYVWNVKEIRWDVYNGRKLDKLGNLNPMAAFVLYSDEDGSVNLNYEKLIWNTNK